MKRSDGRYLHRYRDGEVAIPGFIEDYAFLSLGLADLYEASFNTRYLKEAKRLLEEMHRLFWDEVNGGFFFTGSDSDTLIVRNKELYDGAVPSGNSVAALALLRVGRLTMEKKFEKWAQETVDTFSGEISRFPAGYPQMLQALDFAFGPTREIVVVGDSASPETHMMFDEINSHFLPNQVTLFHPSDERQAQAIESLVPFIKNQTPMEGKATVYICHNTICRFPTTNIDQFKQQLSE